MLAIGYVPHKVHHLRGSGGMFPRKFLTFSSPYLDCIWCNLRGKTLVCACDEEKLGEVSNPIDN